ncbi:SGNH/GDSL hydrolase family protein [Microbacterium invictum]|uniref:Lysophospholipase L1-like esterase n=1 Tax=Microbacterium invictum TaxID=515415 RepID=A0AA40VNG0_9MICO|nr:MULTISPECIES: SGNH/GDSL hydrolase family protein [Microbacterium]MBB4141329.1 lysophospholipase L1-like esterase [Microbacterium invictum]
MLDRYRHMVALGSSFAAGPGVQPIIDRAAMRSGRNYAHLVASSLGAELTDASVSGATTSTILHSPQRTLRRVFAQQIESVDESTDLVTITAGGNDLGYIGAVMRTAMLNRFAESGLIRPLAHRMQRRRPLALPDEAQVQAATDGLVEICREAQRRAPRATVLLVGYLPLFDETDAEATGFSPEQVAHFRDVDELLSRAYGEASRLTGARMVAASGYPSGHGVGSADPWVNGLQLWRSLASSFHPNAAGMRAVAVAILHHLDEYSVGSAINE